jgi:hypothetical protein
VNVVTCRWWLKALARGFRWRRLLETGDYATIEEIVEAENINPSYVSRVLRMTLLAPEIVEAILAGRHPEGLTMAREMQPFPYDWSIQSAMFHGDKNELCRAYSTSAQQLS